MRTTLAVIESKTLTGLPAFGTTSNTLQIEDFWVRAQRLHAMAVDTEVSFQATPVIRRVV